MNSVSPHFDKNADKIKANFLAELRELLKQYKAEITAENIGVGWDSEVLRIRVSIDGVYEGPTEQQHSYISMDLGPIIWGPTSPD